MIALIGPPLPLISHARAQMPAFRWIWAYAEVPRLAWLAYQERVFEGLNVELTRAAPSTVSIDGALAYLAEVLQEEQEQLSEEYRRFLERHKERQRSTPPPLRPDSK